VRQGSLVGGIGSRASPLSEPVPIATQAATRRHTIKPGVSASSSRLSNPCACVRRQELSGSEAEEEAAAHTSGRAAPSREEGRPSKRVKRQADYDDWKLLVLAGKAAGKPDLDGGAEDESAAGGGRGAKGRDAGVAKLRQSKLVLQS
jgi:hypothetical protein